MIKIRAVISGNIQNVGYRAKVIGIAKDFGLTGFVQNLDDGRVKVIAESENGNFEKFLDAIRIKNTLIRVDDIAMEYADATGDFADFYKLVSGGETDERLDVAAVYLKKLISVTERGFGNLDSKMDVMIEKQDETTTEIRAMKGEMRSGFSDMRSGFSEMRSGFSEMLAKQDETTTEIRGLREDMKTYTDRKFGEIESELDVIKSALRAKEILC